MLHNKFAFNLKIWKEVVTLAIIYVVLNIYCHSATYFHVIKYLKNSLENLRMKNSFSKIFAYFNYILTQQEILDHIVSVQPYIEYSIRDENSDKLKDDEETVTIPKGERTAHLEIKFAVDYRDSFKHNTQIQKIVTLKRYKKKQTSDEKYDELLHAPDNISLSQENSNRTIFKVDIRVPDNEGFVTSNNIDKKRYVISFQSSTNTPAKSSSDIKKLNESLLSYMVDDIDKLSNFGFRFFFKVILKADNGEVVSKTVVSDIFGFSHNEDLLYLNLWLLNQDDFHMAPPVKDINVGKFSKFTKSFKRKKNNLAEETEKKSKCVIS